MNDWNPAERTRALSIMMTQWRSETGTEGEKSFAGKLAAHLAGSDYFRRNPTHLRLLPAHDGTFNLVALMRGGAGRSTLVMAGHYDTVPVANYRDLAPLACDPEPLLQALLDDLRSRPLSQQEEKALADFESGDFVAGRGLLDMKAGLAAGIAAMEQLALTPGFTGNILFCATPDEERNSRGMRALRDALPALCDDWGIDIAGGLNLDSTSDQGDGAEGRAIYRGTIGKLLPFAFVLGQPSHASYPFEGVSAHLIAAEILRRVEANPALCDTGDGELSPPPICLEGKDFRAGYDVTTPDAVWLGFNWLFHSWQAEHLFERFNAVVREAAQWATASFAAHAQSYAALSGAAETEPEEAALLTFEELRIRAFAAGGDDTEARFHARAAELAGLGNPLETSRLLTGWLVAEARLSGPAVITGFAGLHYPPTKMADDPASLALMDALEGARQALEAQHGVTIRYRTIFTGISDMSFLGHRPQEAGQAVIAANTADPAMVDRPPANALSFPVVNIGPWGREYHQRLERAYGPYAFDHLPRMLADTAFRLFAGT